MQTLWPYLFTIAVAAVLVYLNRRSFAGDDAYRQWQDALDQAPAVVAAVEQLWQTGALPKDKRLDMALKQLGEWFPALSETQLRIAIESAVWMLKEGVALVDEGDN